MSAMHQVACAAAALSLLGLTASASAVLTPEQRAGANGQIPDSNAQEYYLGPINVGQSTSGDIVGGVAGTLPSLSWYKYVSDGSTPVVFDMFGSVFGFGGGGLFTGGPDGELALYDVNGHFIAGNEGVKSPSNGDSNIPPVVPDGAPPAPVTYRQPRDPTKPVYEYDSGQGKWFSRNNNGLPQLAMVPSPQDNPLWSSVDPNYDPYADWSQYHILPAGTYFLAVTGYSTYFAGNPRDVAIAGDDTSNPFGFVSYHAQTGTYVLNARLAGDMNLDASLNSDDISTLIAKIRELAAVRGISPDGFSAGEWQGLPDNLQRFDITGNSRIDLYDMGALGRYSGLAVPVFSQWAISGGGDWSVAIPSNWSGNGVPDGVDHAASFGTFDGTITAAQTVNLTQPVTVGALNFDNDATYTISSSGVATITMDVSLSPDAQINVFLGSHTIVTPILLNHETTINVAAGQTLSVEHLRRADSATAGITITSGTLRILPNSTANDPKGTSIVSSLSVSDGALVDLTNNSMVIDYSGPVGTLLDDTRVMLKNNQLTSSSADATRRLGYLDNATRGLATFSGQSVDASSILIKFTYGGDANLDGQVDVTDLGALATNWQTSTVWPGGDFNYDGFVDVTDLGILATDWQLGVGSPLGPGSLQAALEGVGLGNLSVPEPASLGLIVLGAVFVKRTRLKTRVA